MYKILSVLVLVLYFQNIVFATNTFSTGYCSDNGFRYIKLGNSSTTSPCSDNTSIYTISWNTQELNNNNQLELYQCKIDQTDLAYYQVGNCGSSGTQYGQPSSLDFTTTNKYFYIFNCIFYDWRSNSYATILTTSTETADNFMKSFMSTCSSTGGNYFSSTSWVYNSGTVSNNFNELTPLN